MLAHIVDTPVRGLVYETGGEERPAARAAAERVAATYSMPVEVVAVAPVHRGEWLAGMTAAVGRVLSA
jgi:hypothetical protein